MTRENLYLEMLIRHSLLCSVLTLVCVFCCPVFIGSCSSKRLTTAWTHSTGLCAAMSTPRPGGGGWPGGPASGTRRRAGGAEVKAAASRAAEECGQLAFPRGWGRGPARPAGRGTGEGGVGEEAGGGGGEGSPGRGGRLWVALPTSAVSPQPSQSETPP